MELYLRRRDSYRVKVDSRIFKASHKLAAPENTPKISFVDTKLLIQRTTDTLKNINEHGIASHDLHHK